MIRRMLWFWLLVGSVLMAVGIARGQCGPGGCPTYQSRGIMGGSSMTVPGGYTVQGGGLLYGQRVCGPNGCSVVSPPQAGQGQGQTQAGARQPSPVVVRVESTRGDVTAHGTGAIVKWRRGRGLIVTVAHVLKAGARIVVRFATGQRYYARVVATDATRDAALLEIACPNRLCMPLAKRLPRRGQAIYWAGYGQGSYQTTYSEAVGVDGDLLGATGNAREGDSGSPIYNAEGELVGIVAECTKLGNGPWTTSGPSSVWLAAWIKAEWTDGNSPDEAAVGVAPLPPAAGVAPAAGDLTQLRAEIAQLREAIDGLALKEGPPGKDGRDGKDGAQGPAGKDADTRPWYLRTINPATGKETVTEIFPGDTVTLKLFEYPKPKPE